MTPSRREFLQWTSASALALTAAGVQLFPREVEAAAAGFKPDLLPSADEVWDWQVWMNNLGPKYTGNDAHRKFVDFLASNLKSTGLDVTRDTYKLPRWEAHTWRLQATPKAGGRPLDLPLTFYYPYSGETGPTGVTGELMYGGTVPSDGSHPPDYSSSMNGKIVFLDYQIVPRPYPETYKPWGFYTPDTKLVPVTTALNANSAPQLDGFKKAGARGVIFGFMNVSNEQAADQYLPFGRAMQGVPAVWVGRDAGSQLRKLAEAGATATLTLDAEVFPDSPTDTVIATLPGASSDEVIIVNTHTDGPNALEENGGVGILALAKYFAKVPKADRKRTLVFLLTTGHFAFAYFRVNGFIDRHADIIRKTVGAVTVEHLGCREWLDDASMKYVATGKDELSNAITDYPAVAKITLESLQQTADRRVAVVTPTPKGRWSGEGAGLTRAGIPTLGYIPIPTYLCMAAQDGCISKLSRTLMHGQIQAFAKIIHAMDTLSAADLKSRS